MSLLLRSIVALSLAAPPPGGEASSVPGRLDPVQYDGEVSEVWQGRFEQRLRAGLGLPSDPHAPAADAPRWVAVVTVTRTDAEFRLVLQAKTPDSREVLAEVKSVCELCGEGEVAERLQTHAAKLAAQLEASLGIPARLILRTRPPGASVELDGEPQGLTPADLEVDEGSHEVELSLEGYQPSTLRFEALAGLSITRDIELQPHELPPPPMPRHKRPVAPIVLTTVGAAAVVAGTILLVLHGREVRTPCQADADGDCRELFGTRVPGAIVLSTGGVLGIVGGALWIRHARRANRRSSG